MLTTSVNSWASNDRLLSLVDLSPDGIFVHDGEQIVFANRAAVRLTGATHLRQVVGAPIEQFLAQPYLKAAAAEISGAGLALQESSPVRETLTRINGTAIPVEVRALSFVDHGQPYVHLVVRDVSERVAADEAALAMDVRLQHAQRMEAVGALAGGVAHEVNNMMTVVLGFSEFLLTDGHLNAEATPDVIHITQAARRAADITQQLLAFSRRTTAKAVVADLSEIVTSSEATIRRILSARKLVLSIDAHSVVCVDPSQIEQVLVNLALNARDATLDGDVVTIATAVVALAFGNTSAEGSVIPAGEYATLSVRDAGGGMDEATKKRIFEPFFSTKPIGKGTGLGLAAVHGLLTQAGCYIKVVSAPDAGAEFVIYVPIYGTKSTNQHDRDAFDYHTVVSAPRGTVLVVDYEASLRIIAIRALEDAGYSVITASDEREALQLLSQNGPPSIVIIDVTKPIVRGSELAQQLHVRWPGMPIVLMTGYLEADFTYGGVPLPGVVTLQKPFTPSQLLSSVILSIGRSKFDRDMVFSTT